MTDRTFQRTYLTPIDGATLEVVGAWAVGDGADALGPGGLLMVFDSRVFISCTAEHGNVSVTVERWDGIPPEAGTPWAESAEVSIEVDPEGEHLWVGGEEEYPPEEALLTPPTVSTHRLRVNAHGRSSVWKGIVNEAYLVQVWEAPAQPPTAHS